MKDSLKYLSLITQVGLTAAFMVFFFTFLGVYLDRVLKTEFVFTLLFILVGCFGAIWTAYRQILKSLPGNSEKK